MTPDHVRQVLVDLEMSYGQRFADQYANVDGNRLVAHWVRHLADASWVKWPAALVYLHRSINNGRVPTLADVVEACEQRARTRVAI
jgi:hypothetical protein